MPRLFQIELRAAQHYLAVLRRAGELYDVGGDDLRRGLALSELEWSNIEIRQSWVADHSSEDDKITKLCSDYPDVAPHLLDLRQHPRERIQWLETALAAARRLHEHTAEGRHLHCLGLAYSRLGETVRAIELYKSSLAILRKAGDPRGESEVLSNLGSAYANSGDPSVAISVLEQALAIAREQYDARGEGISLCYLGQSYYQKREFHRAIEFYEESLEITRKIGYLPYENIVLNYLGKTYAILNRPLEAIAYYDQALNIARGINDRQGERNTLGNLGQAYHLLNEVDRAVKLYEGALIIAREIGDRRVEAELLNSLGDAFLDAGNATLALNCYEQRIRITRELGHTHAASAERLFREPSLKKTITVTQHDQPAMEPASDDDQTISWLHISDTHFREAGSDKYNETIVIESFLKDIQERIQKKDLNPDFITATGDLAFSGKPSQYESVREFFDELLGITGLSRQRLFIVPGNHDVDRSLISGGALLIGKSLKDQDSTNAILDNATDRHSLFARFKGYGEFFNEYFKGHLPFDDDNYFYTHALDVKGRRLAILGLNSSWLAASDEDEALKLVIGERQTRAALKAANKPPADIKIALLHHPFDWIRGFDQSSSMALLLSDCDFILHGHLHKAATTHLVDPDSSAMIVAGGACYDTRAYPNSYNFVKINLSSNTGTIYFREYVNDKGGFWAPGRPYRNVPDGVYQFRLKRK